MFTVAAFYKFSRFDNPRALRPALLERCRAAGVKGTVLLAAEGINGTIAGTRAGVDAVLSHVRSLPGCAQLDVKKSRASRPPFRRMKVRIKREIVTLGMSRVDPVALVGEYVEPADWNGLISAPDVALIDMRNEYEVAIGTFEGAIDPGMHKFRDLPSWWEANKHGFHNRRIAMFCTGGIRCEKATSFLLMQGVEEVFHLRGGILKYLEDVPRENSKWQGECFVFDGRVSVGHGLSEGTFDLCPACRRPIQPEDRLRPEFEMGVSCHHCAGKTSAAQKARYRERHRQMQLASQRGVDHLGGS